MNGEMLTPEIGREPHPSDIYEGYEHVGVVLEIIKNAKAATAHIGTEELMDRVGLLEGWQAMQSGTLELDGGKLPQQH